MCGYGVRWVCFGGMRHSYAQAGNGRRQCPSHRVPDACTSGGLLVMGWEHQLSPCEQECTASELNLQYGVLQLREAHICCIIHVVDTIRCGVEGQAY